MTTAADEIIIRARARDAGIWPSFIYAVPQAGTANATIFGIYAYYGENSIVYMREVTAEELASLLADYNAEMAKLSGEEAVLALKIAADRYEAQVNDAIARQGFVVKAQKNVADDAYMTAQIAALESDRKAIQTKLIEAQAFREKMQAQLTITNAEIQEEGVRAAQVDVEVGEKQIAVADANLRLVNLSIEALELRRRINEAALESARINVEIAEAARREAEADESLIEAGILARELASRKIVKDADTSRVGTLSSTKLEESRLATLTAEFAKQFAIQESNTLTALALENVKAQEAFEDDKSALVQAYMQARLASIVQSVLNHLNLLKSDTESLKTKQDDAIESLDMQIDFARHKAGQERSIIPLIGQAKFSHVNAMIARAEAQAAKAAAVAEANINQFIQ